MAKAKLPWKLGQAVLFTHDMQDRESEQIAKTIAQTAARGVDRFEIEGMGGSALPIGQQIAADRHLAARKAARHPLFGVRLIPIIPGRSL